MLEHFVTELEKAASEPLRVEAHILPVEGQRTFRGYNLASGDGRAAEIEVWEGGAGWNLFVEDALTAEIPPEDSSLLLSTLWAVVEGGCAVYRKGLTFWFIAGSIQPTETEGTKIVKFWLPWPEVSVRHEWTPSRFRIFLYRHRKR